jgi:hypothetical protein
MVSIEATGGTGFIVTDVVLIVLLIDERPEEVADMQAQLGGFASLGVISKGGHKSPN